MKEEVITLNAYANKHQTKFDGIMNTMKSIMQDHKSNITEAMQRLWI